MNLEELLNAAGLEMPNALLESSALPRIIEQICSKDFPEPVLSIEGDTWVAVEVLRDYKIWINLKDKHVSRNILIAKEWEVNESEFIRDYLNIGETFIDIGANIGWFSLLAASVVGSSGHVFSFEARPDIYRYLRKTIIDNHLQEQVTTFNVALGDKADVVNICDVNATNPGASCLGPEGFAGRSWPIQMQKLDDLLDCRGVNMIKIDVEGAEHLVFQGADRILGMKPRPIIVSEVNPKQLAGISRVSPEEYIEFMSEKGFDCFLLHEGRPTERIRSLRELASADIYSVVFF